MTINSTHDDLLAEAVDWRMRVDAAPQDAAVRAGLEAWLGESEAHRSAYKDVEHMARVASSLPADYADPQGSILGGTKTKKRAPVPGRARLRVAGLAAVALAACIAFLFLPVVQVWLDADYHTGTAELRTVTLDDGTIVSLDAESAIAVRYDAGRREVALLSGQAYFEVVPAVDRPFIVVVDDATITVTGTAFDVRSSAGSIAVAVQSGTVEVALDRGRRLAATLGRGERLEIDKGSGRVGKADIVAEDVAAWRQRRMIVDRATIADVIEELGRHYGGVVLLQDRELARRRVSGVFDLSQPVEALQAVVQTHDGRVTRITPYLMVISGP